MATVCIVQWGEEAIWTLAKYFHLISWCLPAVLTTIAVVLRKIDADELTGLCYIGSSSSSSAAVSLTGGPSSSTIGLVSFVVVPLVTCLAVGTGFVGAGFGAVRRVRRALQQRQRWEGSASAITGINGVDRLERLMVKMAVFSALYAVPIATVLGCLLYETRGSTNWQLTARTTPCRPPASNSELFPTADDCRLDESTPAVEVFLVKVFASLMPGIGGGVWIWSMKTARSWRHCVQRCLASTGGRQTGKLVPPTGAQRSSRVGGPSNRSLAGRMVRWPGGIVTVPPSSPCSPSSMEYNPGHLFTVN